MLCTNPVVVRRMMSGLRHMGIVTSERGHGGGWRLARNLADITILDVYRALGEPPLFNISPGADKPDCLVEQAVDARMEETLHEAEVLLRDRFGAITIADLAEEFERRAADQTEAGQDCSGPRTVGVS